MNIFTKTGLKICSSLPSALGWHERNKFKILICGSPQAVAPSGQTAAEKWVSFSTFSDLAKWVYVDVAAREFTIKVRKQTTSRVSVITGLSRREVMRVRKLQRPNMTAIAERHNRAVRVITAWRREKDFLDINGKPALLPIEGSGSTFSELVKRFSGNVPHRAILDELIHVGAVEKMEDGRINLRTRVYIPQNLDAHKLNILGTDVYYLISTIGHNLQSGSKEPLFQRKVAYDNWPDQVLPEFHKRFAKRAQSLLESADKWLAQHDRDITPAVEGIGSNRAGFGIYFFEESVAEKES